jgi:hypothetical protein
VEAVADVLEVEEARRMPVLGDDVEERPVPLASRGPVIVRASTRWGAIASRNAW